MKAKTRNKNKGFVGPQPTWYRLPLTSVQKERLKKHIDGYSRRNEAFATRQGYRETAVILTLLLCCNVFGGNCLTVWQGFPQLRVDESPVLYKLCLDGSWFYRNEPVVGSGLGEPQGADGKEVQSFYEDFGLQTFPTTHTNWPCDTAPLQTKVDLLCLLPWDRLSDDGNIREQTGIPIDTRNFRTSRGI